MQKFSGYQGEMRENVCNSKHGGKNTIHLGLAHTHHTTTLTEAIVTGYRVGVNRLYWCGADVKAPMGFHVYLSPNGLYLTHRLG